MRSKVLALSLIVSAFTATYAAAGPIGEVLPYFAVAMDDGCALQQQAPPAEGELLYQVTCSGVPTVAISIGARSAPAGAKFVNQVGSQKVIVWALPNADPEAAAQIIDSAVPPAQSGREWVDEYGT